MNLTVLDSGSHGNGYVLQNDTEALVIECGVRFDDCRRALNSQTSKVVGCIISHEHGDHAKYIEKYMESSMQCYCTGGTATAIKYKGNRRPNVVKYMKEFTVGRFTIKPFEIKHDSAEPAGFLISHPEIGLLLFATDTCYLKPVVQGLTQIMIECNHSLDIMDRNVAAGKLHPNVRDRILQYHMSLETTISTLQANNLREVNNILLLHLSGKNSDPERFYDEVSLATGKTVKIARKGVEININKTPF